MEDSSPESLRTLKVGREWPEELRILADTVRSWFMSTGLGRRDKGPRAALHLNRSVDARLQKIARQEGLESFVYASCREAQTVSEEVVAALRRAYSATAVANAVASDDLVRVLAEFEAQGVSALVLKGAFLSHVVYRNIALRPMGDIDLLVKPEHVQAAHTILTTTFGMRPLSPANLSSVVNYSPFLNSFYYLPAVGAVKRGPTEVGTAGPLANDVACRDRRAAVRGEPIGHAPGNIAPVASAIHLHWHLVNASYPLDFYGRKIDMDRIWRESRSYDADGLRLPGLAPHHLLIHLCEHGLKHGFSELRQLADIAAAFMFMERATARRSNHPEVTDAFLADVVEFGLERAAYYGLLFASRVFGLDVPCWLLEALQPRRRFRCELLFERLFMRNIRRVGLNWLVYFAMMGSSLERLSFVFRTFWPGRRAQEVLVGPATGPGTWPADAWPTVQRRSRVGRLSRLLRGALRGLEVVRCLLG